MKTKFGKPQDILERTFNYSLRAIRLYTSLRTSKNDAALLIGKQYLKSATSIGANVEEAQSAESRADFIHKYNIGLKEARESLYWLRLLSELNVVSKDNLMPLLKETQEIVAVISSIIISAKKKG